jgi:ribosomal-protein-alanine N-acetyltransferase
VAVPLPIETERLLVRAFDPVVDPGPMLAVYGDPEVMRFVPGGAVDGLESVAAMVEGYAVAQQVQGFSSWAVVERATGHVIGDAGFGVFRQTGDVELGYTLAREHWGRGLATEAARACLEAGLVHLSAPRIVAVVDEANTASLRVAERIGMARVERIEAYGRPHVVFSVRRPAG